MTSSENFGKQFSIAAGCQCVSTNVERDDLYNANSDRHITRCTDTHEPNQYEVILTQNGEMIQSSGTDSEEDNSKFESTTLFSDNSNKEQGNNHLPDLMRLMNSSEGSLDFSEENFIEEYEEIESCEESNCRENSFLEDLWWNKSKLDAFELELENMEINASDLNEMESTNVMGELLARRRKQRVRGKQISGFYFNLFARFLFLFKVYMISVYTGMMLRRLEYFTQNDGSVLKLKSRKIK